MSTCNNYTRVLFPLLLILFLTYMAGQILTQAKATAPGCTINPGAYAAPLTLQNPFSVGTTIRVSLASDGAQGNYPSAGPSISADGRYVAFSSIATNLVSDDTNDSWDVFIHDLQTGQTSRVSIASDGAQGNGNSLAPPHLSANGRYVTFYSDASNLVPDDTNGSWDVFVHDRQNGQTSLVSIASDGAQGNSNSSLPSISADGRYVAFESMASNLVLGDTNGMWDIFVHDRHTGQTKRISIASDGAQGNSNSSLPSISADGRYVAFESLASNLVPSDTSDMWDIFVHDRHTGQTNRVSIASDSAHGNGSSRWPSISADGRYVAFHSDSSNLVPGDTNDWNDIFVHDQQSGQTSLVSIACDNGQGNDTSYTPSISADGRYVAFRSGASNLVPGDTNGAWDIFVHDQQTGQTSLISISSDETQGNNESWNPRISADGRYVAFTSNASNLVTGDTNGFSDIFVHDRNTSVASSISGRIVDVNNNNVPGVIVLTHTGQSATTNANGDYIITDLIPGDYTLTPNKTGYTFTPTSRTVTLPPDATEQNFIAFRLYNLYIPAILRQ